FNGISAFFLLLPGFLGPPDRGWIRRALGSAVGYVLGALSYGVFLWHPIAIDQIAQWRTDHDKAAPNFWLMLVIVLAFSLTAAALSYVFVERPALRLRDPVTLWRRWQDRRDRGTTGASATAGARVEPVEPAASGEVVIEPAADPVGDPVALSATAAATDAELG